LVVLIKEANNSNLGSFWELGNIQIRNGKPYSTHSLLQTA
jgi:hypothetical protein